VRLREGGNPVEQHGTDNTIHVEPNSNTNTGAQFIQLQVCMNMQTLRDYVSRLISTKLTWRIQMLAELAVFSSAEGARALRKILSDAIIPADVVRRLEASGVCPDRLKTVSRTSEPRQNTSLWHLRACR